MTFSKKLMSNSLPPGKNVRSNITKLPTPGKDLWSRARKTLKYPYPGDSKIIQIPYPRAKAIDKNPGPMPRLSPPPPHPRRLDIDRCFKTQSLCFKFLRFEERFRDAPFSGCSVFGMLRFRDAPFSGCSVFGKLRFR